MINYDVIVLHEAKEYFEDCIKKLDSQDYSFLEAYPSSEQEKMRFRNIYENRIERLNVAINEYIAVFNAQL